MLTAFWWRTIPDFAPRTHWRLVLGFLVLYVIVAAVMCALVGGSPLERGVMFLPAGFVACFTIDLASRVVARRRGVPFIARQDINRAQALWWREQSYRAWVLRLSLPFTVAAWFLVMIANDVSLSDLATLGPGWFPILTGLLGCAALTPVLLRGFKRRPRADAPSP